MRSVIEPETDLTAQLKASFTKLLDLNKPRILDTRAKDNAITQMDKDYKKTLLSFKEHGIHGENFTIFEFYTTLEFYAEKSARMKAEIDKIKSKQ